jgi:hypothetical protein
MEDSLNDTGIKKANQLQAKYIAIVVRNAMEDFHSKYLSDEQMRELNPIIRNAIYTALYTINDHGKPDHIRAFIKPGSTLSRGWSKTGQKPGKTAFLR